MAITRSQRKEQLKNTPIISNDNDTQNIILLVILYLLQGVPLGLSFGSIPYLLKSKLNYSDLALFSLSSYPYSLKLFWSPIVDSIYFKSFGRRKSWIVPLRTCYLTVEFILGLCLLFIGNQIDDILESEDIPVMLIASVFTVMVFLCATQDIAVDGWALSLLTDENKTYASTAQTIGLNSGYFLSFTVFLAFNSPEFCNKYLLATPSEKGVLSLGQYLKFWGVMFLLCNVGLLLFKTETPEAATENETVGAVYRTLLDISKLPHMRKFMAVLMVAKIGFQANEAATGLKLLELGFNKEYLALSVLLDFPLQMIFGYYAAKWSSGDRPLRPWMFGFYGRLVAAFVGMVVVAYYPKNGVDNVYLTIVMLATVLSSFMNSKNCSNIAIQFVGMGSYFTKISDPAIGGTYMTFLNTLSNLGGTWPRYFVLLAIDYFTDAPCSAFNSDGTVIKCSDEKSRDACKTANGTCSYISDGYYIVNIACIMLGIVSLYFYIKPTILKLESLPDRAWRLKSKKS